ncbi:MAG: ROK family protein [Syntrophobacteraceae bacterium]
MHKPVFIGVDIGGTNLRVALVDTSGQILKTTRTRIRIDLGARAASERVAAQCLKLARMSASLGFDLKAIGLGVAGRVDKPSAGVIFSPNLPAMRNYPIGSELRERTGFPVFIENDANCFGLGEHFAGAARGLENWVGITLGTGTGGCLILNGKLWEGDGLGFSAEIGHMIILPDGPPCPCGSKGCLESFASARALVRSAGELIEDGGLTDAPLVEAYRMGTLDAATVYESALRGNAEAAALFDKLGWALGLAIANLFSILGIRHAIIGGGVSAGWDLFIGPLKASLSRNISMLEPEKAVVIRSSLGDNAALVGAARTAMENTI